MEAKVMKSKPLSKEETKALLEFIEKSKIIISKATNATNNKLKDEEWNRITEQFNATATSCPRLPQQLRLKWENLKKNARKRSTKIRMNHIQTGGGIGEYIPPDEVLDRVTSLLGSTATGFVAHYGGDMEAEENASIRDGDGGSVEELGGDATINLEIIDFQDAPNPEVVVLTPKPIPEPEPYKTPDTPRRVTFNIPKRTGKRKIQGEGHRSDRDIAIAEYFRFKKQCLEAKFSNIQLQNEKLQLEINYLKSIQLEREKL